MAHGQHPSFHLHGPNSQHGSHANLQTGSMGRSRSHMASSKVGQLQHQASATAFRQQRNIPPADSFEHFDFSVTQHGAKDGASERRMSNLLQVPSQQVRLSSMYQMHNPVSSFYNDSDGPYLPGSRTNADLYRFPHGIHHTNNVQPIPNVNYSGYPKRAHSDIGSAGSGHYHPPDSGYGGSATVASVRSLNTALPDDHSNSSQSFSSQNSQNQRQDFNIPLQQPRESQDKPAKTVKRKKILPPCAICHVVPTCPSDQKKHQLKHAKPHRCARPECKREEGFTTPNDLDRHMKSVHHEQGKTKSYQCTAPNCKTPAKIWPRLDNFKQHVSRMHKDRDTDELIRMQELLLAALEYVLINSRGTIEPKTQPDPPPASDINFAGMEDVSVTVAANIEQTPSPNDFTDFMRVLDQGVGNVNKPVEYALKTTNATPPAQDGQIETVQHSTGPLQASTTQAQRYPPPHSHRAGLTARLDALATVAEADGADPVETSQIGAVGSQPGPEQPSASTSHTKALSKREFLLRVLLDSASDEAIGKLTDDLSGRSVSSSRTIRSQPSPYQPDVVHSHIKEHSRKGAALTSGEDSNIDPALQTAHSPSLHNTGKPSTSKDIKQCRDCKKAVSRNSELNKHMKRHTRPYGCTYPKCNKTFGSKNDWKRHENSQHFQLETWRCDLPCSTNGIGIDGQCATLFYRKQVFLSHLSSVHCISSDTHIESKAREVRIGRNGQGQFWCGFCRKIVPLQKKRDAAWNERFDHIDNHFSKEKRKIGEWLCLEARKEKEVVRREMDKTNFDDGEGMGEGHEHCSSSRTPSSLVGIEDSPCLDPASLTAGPSWPAPRKRGIDAVDGAEGQGGSARQRIMQRYCCQCGNGPYDNDLCERCPDHGCEHLFCDACNSETSYFDDC